MQHQKIVVVETLVCLPSIKLCWWNSMNELLIVERNMRRYEQRNDIVQECGNVEMWVIYIILSQNKFRDKNVIFLMFL